MDEKRSIWKENAVLKEEQVQPLLGRKEGDNQWGWQLEQQKQHMTNLVLFVMQQSHLTTRCCSDSISMT